MPTLFPRRKAAQVSRLSTATGGQGHRKEGLGLECPANEIGFFFFLRPYGVIERFQISGINMD